MRRRRPDPNQLVSCVVMMPGPCPCTHLARWSGTAYFCSGGHAFTQHGQLLTPRQKRRALRHLARQGWPSAGPGDVSGPVQLNIRT